MPDKQTGAGSRVGPCSCTDPSHDVAACHGLTSSGRLPCLALQGKWASGGVGECEGSPKSGARQCPHEECPKEPRAHAPGADRGRVPSRREGGVNRAFAPRFPVNLRHARRRARRLRGEPHREFAGLAPTAAPCNLGRGPKPHPVPLRQAMRARRARAARATGMEPAWPAPAWPLGGDPSLCSAAVQTGLPPCLTPSHLAKPREVL
jgi:hypothetical protein